jgi:hypothetical protein
MSTYGLGISQHCVLELKKNPKAVLLIQPRDLEVASGQVSEKQVMPNHSYDGSYIILKIKLKDKALQDITCQVNYPQGQLTAGDLKSELGGTFNITLPGPVVMSPDKSNTDEVKGGGVQAGEAAAGNDAPVKAGVAK